MYISLHVLAKATVHQCIAFTVAKRILTGCSILRVAEDTSDVSFSTWICETKMDDSPKIKTFVSSSQWWPIAVMLKKEQQHDVHPDCQQVQCCEVFHLKHPL